MALPTQEKSLVLIKPDGVLRGLVGDIVTRFERCGLKLVAMKMVLPSAELIGQHYAEDVAWMESVGNKTKESYEKRGITVTEAPVEIGRRIRQQLMDGIRIAPVMAMIWQGNGAIGKIRNLVGSTSPEGAAPGTIRGDYAIDGYGLADASNRSMQNLIHASDAVETAAREIGIWFKPEEVYDYQRNDDAIIYRQG